jgi:DNA polymerase-3 subunit epsilon
MWKDDFVILDTETTGFSATARVIEVAVAHIINLEFAAKFVCLVNPGADFDWESPEAQEAIKINGINPRVVSKMPCQSNLSNVVNELLEGRVWVGHNVDYDRKMLCQSFSKAPVPSYMVDTLLCDVGIRPGKHSRKLSSVAMGWNISVSNAHRAMGDVMTTYGILRGMLSKLPNDISDLVVKQKAWKETWEFGRRS